MLFDSDDEFYCIFNQDKKYGESEEEFDEESDEESDGESHEELEESDQVVRAAIAQLQAGETHLK